MNGNSIGIFTNYSESEKNIRGCWKVAHNLIMGLKKMGVVFSVNKIEKYNGCLTEDSINDGLPPNTLIGPEIMVLPNELPHLWGRWKNWAQPAQWVIDYMRTFNECKNNNFSVWPVGIDTDKFNDLGRKNFNYDCFVYYKNVTKQTSAYKLKGIERQLKSRRLKYKILRYGDYEEEDLIKATKDCKFAIFVVGTESQNIALLEVLSSNVPVFVFDEKTFLYSGYSFSNNNVSGAPYFSDQCGCKENNISFQYFDTVFLQNLEKYNPREYVLKNHTLQMGAKKYVDLLLKSHGKQT